MMGTVHKHKYHIRDLNTRAVTLFSTRAQVVRDIKDVPLKPGANEITIVGLTPTVDEHSIKVDGTGSATITDIVVKSLPNRDIFQDVYPDSDDDKDLDEDSGGEDEEDEPKDGEELLAIREKLTSLRDEEKRVNEVIASAGSRLKILDQYSTLTLLAKEKEVDIALGLDTYRVEREKIFEDHTAGSTLLRDVDKKIADLVKEETRLLKIKQKETAVEEKKKRKVQRVKQKEVEKRRQLREKRQKEKTREREECEKFWPRSCYSIQVSLDATNYTPISSRRSSITSTSELVKVAIEKEPSWSADDAAAAATTCDLTLTYVTSSAFWSPSYDLVLSTTTNTGMLSFDAQLTNTTSETWSNCSITLSTSQTAIASLDDPIPVLVPWHLKLGPKGRRGGVVDDILDSVEERRRKIEWQNQQHTWAQQKPRSGLFGVDNALRADPFAYPPARGPGSFGSRGAGQTTAPTGGLLSSRAPPPPPLPPSVPAAFGSPAPLQPQPPPAPAARSLPFNNIGAVPAPLAAPLHRRRASADASDQGRAGGPALDDEATMLPEPQPELDFQESTFEETGLTTTYDLPGLKSLAPSSTSSKQRVARLSFAKVIFSHILVAKYKPVAFLEAKLRNDSKLTLLRGPAGLTLDGSFMGRTSIPRCSAGDSFTISMGNDPAIRVGYSKPDVRRSTSGVFAREDSALYMRSVIVTNTRVTAGKPVHLNVIDQVPISEDERLRVDVIVPRGLVLGGAGVPAGVPARPQDKEEDKEGWGSATATLRRDGEVFWDVELRAGKSVKLALEYEVSLPGGEQAVQSMLGMGFADMV